MDYQTTMGTGSFATGFLRGLAQKKMMAEKEAREKPLREFEKQKLQLEMQKLKSEQQQMKIREKLLDMLAPGISSQLQESSSPEEASQQTATDSTPKFSGNFPGAESGTIQPGQAQPKGVADIIAQAQSNPLLAGLLKGKIVLVWKLHSGVPV